ncbi:helix-turn-helix transcriptional regulator [Cytophaga hutchinsonii]|jgi:AraC-like DNA-binding protein|uniref:Transcriptional regulator, AraC family n=1 Tax=Cytophaga hutchinsonii (strain ATCC 33406 / DSM 1761 / CIP 103989 / NBRC 15051 / NCIMB 9469 / D465) TaxID=269798 RepID=A0A6N4SWP5_CYTH3|nr:AraC family transcriptional regulator [Cytophaga hutchinsonii]ABG60987.1 transcriptional regulator, AraC family [Cytophaga hutchinsonii ATCC 33406]SFX43827.1 transcriptional regulator, AraC family [Cytophaga hutchinsonii ATCC 33406]
MLHIVKTIDSEELNVETFFPEKFFDPEASITEHRNVTGHTTSYGIHHLLYFQNICIGRSMVRSKERLLLNVEYDFSSVVLEFAVSVVNLAATDGSKKEWINYSSNQHNILFVANSNFQHIHQPSDNIELIRIHVDPDFFKRFLPEKKVFDPFRKQLDMGMLARLNEFNLPITPEMTAVLQDIMATQRKGFYKRIMIEAKVIELLMLQFEQYENFILKPFCQSIKKRDIDKMHEVKTIIESNLQTPCSLIDLAHLVGTNEYNLKKSFKEVFGTTVFGYLSQIRMDEARQLLIRGEMNINQISDYIGYKNANHFSTAFKKHFGYNPSELKQ